MARTRRNYKKEYTAGDLRHRVTFLYRKITVASGITNESWEPLCECWAGMEPLSGKEYFDAAAVQREDSIRFIIRYRMGITAERLILHKGVEYNIESIINVDMENVWLEILARSVVPKTGDSP